MLGICVACVTLALPSDDASNLKPDERIVFFPTLGFQADTGDWKWPFHVWVFEPEEDSILRGKLIETLRKSMSLSPADEESTILRHRLGAFLVDNERGKCILIDVGEQRIALPDTDEDGHALHIIRVPAKRVESLVPGKLPTWLTYRAVLDEDDDRTFEGTLLSLPPEGVSVITDIDDTIKITEVLDTSKMLSNTFLKPFRPVPGMAELYAKLAQSGASFHYVSGSPWPLYEPLQEFRRESGFPEGTFHLVPFRLKDATGFEFVLKDAEEKKRPAIEGIMRGYPNRKFVLIGDSGEWDPEIYGKIARQFPEQVLRILIRDVRGQDRTSTRMLEAFKDLPVKNWIVFKDPSELTSVNFP